MLQTVTKYAYAKLNLTLGVLARRADGYHSLDTLMQSVSLYDTVSAERAGDILVTAVGMRLPYDNTVRRAAERYCALVGGGAHIRVIKRLPSRAGMGGGSADAAAALRCLDALYGRLDEETIGRIALSVGADVPFCLHGGLCRAQGIGEALTPLAAAKKMYFVVAKPARGVSTRALFSALTLPRALPDTGAAMAALARGDLPALGKLLTNALQPPAAALVPEIGAIREALLSAGALGASMTGSGSAVFGLFDTREKAEAALPAVEAYPYARVCESV